MKRIWRFLRRRTAREGPEPSGSRGVDELRPHGQDQLHPAAATIDCAPLPLVQERDTGCWGKDDAGHRAGAAGVTQPAPALGRAGEPAVRSESALRKAPRDQEAVEESKSSGGATGSDSSPSHLSPGSHQPSDIVDAEVFQRITVQLLSVREDMSRVQETNKSLCRQLSRAKREVEELRKGFSEKTSALNVTQRKLHQVRRQAQERHAVLLETDQERKDAIEKAEELQEELDELRTENLFLRQHLGEVQETAQAQTSKISKLQQKLKDSQHQLLVAEARVSDKKLLEEELKRTRAKEACAQQELHEERLNRKLLEQQVEELQQQLQHLQDKEASLTKMQTELQAKTLQIVQESITDWSEHLQCQQENQKLSEQLSLLKEENKALYEEGVRLLNQKDLCVRKYNEMQLCHEDEICRAKETFIHEGKQRESRIKQLENELSETKLQVEKGKALVAEIAAENEKLLQERRRLLQEMTDQEEPPWSNPSTSAATLQSRAKIPDEENVRLDEENVRLHESERQLSGHVPTSQPVPRRIHAPNMEDSKRVNFSECQLQSKGLPSPRTSSPSQEPPGSLSTLQATQETKPEGEAASQDSSLSLSPSQASEIGYLNVASPGETTASQLQKERQSISSEDF